MLSRFKNADFITKKAIHMIILNHKGLQDLNNLMPKAFINSNQYATCPTSTSGKHKFIYKNYVQPCPEGHDHKNMRLKRPMSPHLTIYAPTLTAMTSIAQRITGVIIVFYTLLLSGGTLFLSNGIDTYVSAIQSLGLGKTTVFLLKLIAGLPFAYHYYNGMRFCSWNAAKFLSLKDVYKTAKLVFILAPITALFFAIR